MTTVPRQSLNGRATASGTKEDASAAGDHAAAERVAPPPKMRRRPLLIVASVAAVCLGALLAVFAFSSMSSAEKVLAVRTTVHRGEVITRDDLMTVQVGVDPALHPMPASSMDVVVGNRAAMDLAAGGLVTKASVTSTVVPAQGMSVVAVSLQSGSLPATGVTNGDRVRLVLTPGQNGQFDTSDTPTAVSATVVDEVAGATSGQQVVDVLVPSGQAPDVGAMAATGKVILVLDSRER